MRSPDTVSVEVEEVWLTSEELAEKQGQVEQRRRKQMLRRFGIPVASWDIAAAPHVCARFWQWGSTEPIVVGAFYQWGQHSKRVGSSPFECGCRDYYAFYLVVPRERE